MDKNKIRKDFITARKNISIGVKQRLDKKITETVLHFIKSKELKNILVYHSLTNEVNTLDIINSLLERGNKVALPISLKHTKEIDCKYITALDKDVVPGAYGIFEPDKTLDSVPESDLSAVIVPGVAFDKYGNRLGYGAGYYDKFLTKNKYLLKIAICYAVQIYEGELPFSEHDIKMNYIITENNVFRIT